MDNGRHQWSLPSLKGVFQVGSGYTNELFDVKFYPYTKHGEYPIVAVVGAKLILILRLKRENGFEVIQAINDNDEETNVYYSCVWTKHTETGLPLLCVAGHNSKINIIDALTGRLLRTLVGHGANVNDLAVSPTNPGILASASEDATVRIWSLKGEYEKHACVAICAGEGHRGHSIQTIAFHANGRYLLSGGIDHIINLWGIPELPNSKIDVEPVFIHYPLFSTSQVHSDIVDCVAFHGDLILSKALKENCIVLWLIAGFSSNNPIPEASEAPSTHYESTKHAGTRSAFKTLPSDRIRGTYLTQYERLLQFKIPGCSKFYMRFSLSSSISSSPTAHPILMFANGVDENFSRATKVFYWDLARLDAYENYISSMAAVKKSSISDPDSTAVLNGPKRPPWLLPSKSTMGKDRIHAIRPNSETSSMTLSVSAIENDALEPQPLTMTTTEFAACKDIWDGKYAIDDPLRMLTAHKEIPVARASFTARQCAWSPSGETCVVVGSGGMVAILGRWGSVA